MLNTPSEGARWCLRMAGEGVLRVKGKLGVVEDNGAVRGPSSKKIDCCCQVGTFWTGVLGRLPSPSISVISSQIGKGSSERARRTVGLTPPLTLLTGAERETLATPEVRPLLDRGTGMALVGVGTGPIDCWRRLASFPEGRPSFGGGNDLKIDLELVSGRSESDELLRKGSKKFDDGFFECSETLCDVASTWAEIAGGDGWRAGRRGCLAGVMEEPLSSVG